jgi:hypothetical protein
MACADSLTAPIVDTSSAGDVDAAVEPRVAPVIKALSVGSITPTQAIVAWATDHPALGLVEYGTTAKLGDSLTAGTPPETTYEVLIGGLAPATTYHLRVTAQDSAGTAETSSNRTFTTAEVEDTSSVPSDSVPEEPPTSDDSSVLGIWIGMSDLAQLPTSGSAWTNILSVADGSCGTVDLADQTQNTNTCIMAKALVFARTGESSYRTEVLSAIDKIVTAGTYTGRALALGRELAAYVIAADMIDLKNHDSDLDARFRGTLSELRTTHTSGAASSLIDCHEKRPNNWGAHCGATRAAIAVYLEDTDDLARTAQVFKGYLGDRSSYAGFKYGGPAGEEDLTWQCDPARPVGINPAGCSRNGLSLDGVLPDDQRRGGSFTTSPPKENYVWEALQGLIAQAVILHRAGYPVWEWEDRALLRAVDWLHEVVDFPAEGDDTWQPHIINLHYGASFPAEVPSRAGKNVGWTDWSHRN